MPLDPTIPLGIKPYNGPDLQGTMQTAGGLLNLMSNQQHLQANQIFSEAYKQATDPQTGQTDYGRLQAIVSQSPAAAFLPEYMGKIAAQRNQQVQFETSQLGLALKQQEDIRNRLGSLRGMPGFGTQDIRGAAQGQIMDAVKAGTLPVSIAMEELGKIAGMTDPKEQANWVNQHFLTSLSAEAKMHALLPQMQTVNAGGTTQVLAIDPMTGQPVTTGVIQNTMSPDTATSPVQLMTPEGVPYATTRQQFLQAAVGQPQSGQGGQQGGGYNGRMNNPASVSNVPAGGVQTGISPAEQATQTAEATARAQQGVGQATELSKAVANAPMRINLLEQAQQILNNPNFASGPGTDWRNNAKSLINSTPGLGALARSAGLDPENIKNYDEFNKIMTQYANGVSAGLGSGTDARLNAALTGNPNPKISTLANQDIIAKTIAAEKMQMAQNYAFQNAGVPQSKFQQWQSQWNATVNPDAFVFTSMNPKQQQDFIKRQSPAQMTKFKADLGNMVRAGYIKLPGQ